MSLTKPPHPSRSSLAPLSTGELTEADQVGIRLANALQIFFAAVPTEDRTIRGLAGALEVNRNICQRALAISERNDRGSVALLRGPGSEGLDMLIQGGRSCGVPDSKIKPLVSATRQLNQVVRKLGSGKRSTLLRRIEAAIASPQVDIDDGSALRAMRARLFREAVQTVGNQSETKTLIHVVYPQPGNPQRVACVYLTGHIGYRARAGSLPLRTLTWTTIEEGTGSNNAFPPQLVEHLCSSPTPALTPLKQGRETLFVVDPSGYDEAWDIDVVSAFPGQSIDSPMLSSQVRVGPPSSRLAFDVYLHRELAAGVNPVASVHLYGGGATVTSIPETSWTTRLPDHLSLQLVTPDTPGKAWRWWPRHREATQWLFEKAGLNAGEFMGYRLEVEYPVWGADYVMRFDQHLSVRT